MPQSCPCLLGARHVPWRALSFKICKMGGLEENPVGGHPVPAGAFPIATMMGGSHLLACLQTAVSDALGTATQ